MLSDAEFAVWQARSARWPERGLRYLATRFSAKEAFSKAVGLGMRMPMTWRAVRDRQPAPAASRSSCCTAGSRTGSRREGLTAHVTVTDETDYAASFVVVEQKEHDNHELTTPP